MTWLPGSLLLETESLVGRVDGGYYAPHLSIRTVRVGFPFTRLPITLGLSNLSYVDVVVTGFVNYHEILSLPVVVISIGVMEMNSFF